ncbi:hypothetical protein CALCODRAFT_505756 [Calocera cornea HHB12733]|uniref:Uncharacterized protein n=1 Tax=Calocera cornea HHB12733 TaxID=1353952 RepID=A0A165JRN6_9BASI|nr:hypothetical protein CALCODRAFT_505756 [Calocera cornea HHB12733]
MPPRVSKPRILPCPPPPLFLPTLPADSSEYLRSRDMVVNRVKDLFPELDENGVELPLPVADRRSWPQYHIILVAFLDDKFRRLCWHFRPCERMLTPANSDYPGRYVLVCCYSTSWPDKVCGYRELEMHYEIRIAKNQPLVAPASPIVFPPGQGPTWLPVRAQLEFGMVRIWEAPDEAQLQRMYDQRRDLGQLVIGWDDLDDSDEEGQAGQPRDPSPPYEEEELPRDPKERDRLFWKLFHKREAVKQAFLKQAKRWKPTDQEIANFYRDVAVDQHKMALLGLAPGRIHVRTLKEILAGRRNLIRVQNWGAQEEFRAAHSQPITEDDYDREDWDTRWTRLRSYLRNEGLPFALPFLHECLEASNVLGVQVHQGCLRALADVVRLANDQYQGRMPPEYPPARPDDEGKTMRMDDFLEFLCSTDHQPLREIHYIQDKAAFLSEFIGMHELWRTYDEFEIPWVKMHRAAKDAHRAIVSAAAQRSFQTTMVNSVRVQSGEELLREVLSEHRPEDPASQNWNFYASWT